MKSNRDIAEMLLRIAREDQQVFLLLVAQEHGFRRQAFFHAQQAVEKALKAALAAHGVSARKTHDLEELYGNLESAGLACPLALDELDQLAPYAAMFRYDDTDIPRLDIAVACTIVARTLDWATTHIKERKKS